MKTATLIARGAFYHWRTNLGVLLGAAVAAMVLTGSLMVGDSVRAALKRQGVLRVGKDDAAATAGDRFFQVGLADRIGEGSAPVLMLRGSVAAASGSRVNQAQVLGVDDRFWALAPSASAVPALKGEEIAINERLSRQLGAKVGDTVIVRIEKPGLISRDAPLSGEESNIVAIRGNIARVVADSEFGRFSLQASQVPPYSIFLPLDVAGERLDFKGRANLLLGRGSASTLQSALAQHFDLGDAGLQLRQLESPKEIELRTDRVFLDS